MCRSVGFLIRYHRLKQNVSQEGLCRGICVVSYLSKIEQGLVTPSKEIIHQLFAALHMEYFDDPPFLHTVAKTLHDYIEKIFLQEDASKEHDELLKQHEKLLCSPLCIDMKLVHLFMRFEDIHNEEEAAILRDLHDMKSFEGMMMEEQLFLYHYLHRYEKISEVRIHHLKKAGNCISCSAQKYALAYAYYHDGNYAEALEIANSCYELACNEGNAQMMLDTALLLGNCYCNNRNFALMIKYYHRAQMLARTMNKEDIGSVIAYNLGCSYMEWNQPEKAESYFLESLAKLPLDEHSSAILLYQKMALLYSELHDTKRMQYYLTKADEELEHERDPMIRRMNAFIHMQCDDTKRDQDDALHFLEDFCLLDAERYPYGFRCFHARYLLEAYVNRRRYKEAMQVMERYHLTFS